MTIPWNELAIWWNEVYQGWNEMVWNEVVMERSDRIPRRLVSPAWHTVFKWLSSTSTLWYFVQYIVI